MGLDIVEVVLAIEEEFCIELPMDGDVHTVADFQELVLEAVSNSRLDEGLEALPANHQDGRMPYEEYRLVWEQFRWLPPPKVWFKKKRYDRNTVLSELRQRRRYGSDPELVRTRIAEIIKEQLGLSQLPAPEDRLVEDLGCD